MTEYTAHRAAHHALFVKGLRDLLGWLEPDSTIPTPEHLPITIACDSAERLAEIAIGHDLDGPYTADDGSVYLHRAFGPVSWQAVRYANAAGASDAEQQARAWAALHGCLIVPINHATGSVTP